MNPYISYEAINTKIVSKRGHILKRDDWEKLLDFSTVDQITDFLKNKPEIRKAFQDMKNNDIHRDSLEIILGNYKTIEIEQILHYCSGPYKEFLITMLMENEISDISLILRKISRGEDLKDIEQRFVHSENYTKLDYNRLLSSRSVVQFTENLRGSPYYNGLKTLTNEDAIKREFHIEMKLQVVLYKNLIKKAEKLNDKDKETVNEIIGFKIDLENIQWIYRAISFYDISPEEMLIYSLEGGKKITYRRLKNLCYVKTKEEFKNLVKDYMSFDLFQGVSDSTTDIGIDYNMYYFLKNNKYNNIGSVISYIYKLGTIIDDLICITEGIKYKVPKEKLKGYLAHKF
nr:V-type ATPase subunit [Sedimentibacter sp.]